MSSTSRRATGPIYQFEATLLPILCSLAFVLLGVVLASGELAACLDHRRVPHNLFRYAQGLVSGTAGWPRYATVMAITITLLLAPAIAALVGITRKRWWVRDGHPDRAARWMGKGEAIEPLLGKAARKKAQGFGVKSIGTPIARTVATGEVLWADFEAVMVNIWGPRRGKTVSQAIVQLANAPGVAVATSNKRDLVDATRELRAQVGRVHVYDPQGVAGEPIAMWWNPLTYVRSERHAMEMADVFAAASRDPGAKTDAFFDAQGQQLVADLLMAAAVGDRHLDQIHLWLSDQRDREPVRILQNAGISVFAADLLSKYGAADKERSGVFSTALGICSFMLNAQAMQWVLPPSRWRERVGGETRANITQFDPYSFALSALTEGGGDTLYCLSKEGTAGAGPIVTALTVSVCEAAEDIAKTMPRGRLPVPMSVVLDEAANVCRWRKLPDMYSHYGSRGILLNTILQSWSQGVEVWGREGMAKLWSAANVKIYGGGVHEVEFLENVSKLIGDFDLYSRTMTSGQGTTVQRSTHREKILDVSDLAALPVGRIIVIASGARPTLAKPVSWWELEPRTVALIRRSLELHDPARDGRRDETVPELASKARAT